MHPSLSLEKSKIKILLLEGVDPSAVETLKNAGYTNVEYDKKAYDGQELLDKIENVHFLGIRSRTHLTREVLQHAKRLVGVGFCHHYAALLRGKCQAGSRLRLVDEEDCGIRHVAVLVAVGRRIHLHFIRCVKFNDAVLRVSLGLNVVFYDIENKLSLGNAKQVATLDELFAAADIVTLHVPETDLTQGMIDANAISKMKDGVFLVNASRGTVVNIDDLYEALKSGKVAGAAVDVFPKEPAANGEEFVSPLREFDNVILTPHIGASTEEAQCNIGIEVAQKLALYSDNGSTLTAVNFPEVSLPAKREGVSRLLHVHKNVPGVMRQINEVFASKDINVAAQYLQTTGDVGYVVMDIHSEKPEEIVPLLKQIPATLKCRILY